MHPNSLHPFTSLALWGWLAVSSLLLPVPLLAVLTGGVCLLLLGWPRSRSRWKGVALLVGPIGLSLWIIHGGLLALWLGEPVPDAALQDRMLALWLRLVIIVTTAQMWLAAVPIQRFIRALLGSRLPMGLSMVLAGPLLLAEQLRRQLGVIREAQIARGVPLDGSVAERCRFLPALLFPLVITALQDMTTRSAALDLKAFRAVPRRTTLWMPEDSPWQTLFRMALLGCMLLEAGVWLWRL